MSTDRQAELERLIGKALGGLPLRQAPTSLEQRVLAALPLRQPWWRQNFLHWPLTARAVLVLLCALVARLCLGVSSWIEGNTPLLAAPQLLTRPVAWTERLLSGVGAVRDFALIVLHAIPSQWLLVALIAGAVFYVTFIGLCATAYRTLFAQQVFQR